MNFIQVKQPIDWKKCLVGTTFRPDTENNLFSCVILILLLGRSFEHPRQVFFFFSFANFGVLEVGVDLAELVPRVDPERVDPEHPGQGTFGSEPPDQASCHARTDQRIKKLALKGS